jgi:hypothetical protein
LIFGTTQLAKNEAAEYQSAYTGAEKSVYLFEMGEMYELGWYFDRLSENGLSPFIADTHLIGRIEDVPQLISDLKNAYRNWQKETEPKLHATVARQVSTSFDAYMRNLEKDYSNLYGEMSKEAFRNKYLRSFWTIIATREPVQA